MATDKDMDKIIDSRFKTFNPHHTHTFEWMFEKFSKIDFKTVLSCPKFIMKDGSTGYVTHQKMIVTNSSYQSILCFYNSSTDCKVISIKVELSDQKGNVLLKPTATVYDKENTNAFSFIYANFKPATYLYDLAFDLPDDVLVLNCEMTLSNNSPTTEGYNPGFLKSYSSKSNLTVLSSDFKNILESSVGADITLVVQGNKLLAHKSVLLARCAVFAKMFLSDMKEKSSGVIQIDDIEPRVFELLLLYLYTGVCADCDIETAQALYRAADKYSVLELKEALLAVLVPKISPENAVTLLEMADLHDDKTLRDEVVKFIRFHLAEIPNVDAVWKIFDEVMNANEQCSDLVKKLCLGKNLMN